MDPYHEYISNVVEGIKKDFPNATPEFVLAVLEKEASPKVYWLKDNGNQKGSANEARTHEEPATDKQKEFIRKLNKWNNLGFTDGFIDNLGKKAASEIIDRHSKKKGSS